MFVLICWPRYQKRIIITPKKGPFYILKIVKCILRKFICRKKNNNDNYDLPVEHVTGTIWRALVCSVIDAGK